MALNAYISVNAHNATLKRQPTQINYGDIFGFSICTNGPIFLDKAVTDVACLQLTHTDLAPVADGSEDVGHRLNLARRYTSHTVNVLMTCFMDFSARRNIEPLSTTASMLSVTATVFPRS
jgi:hypothetical protein